MSFLAKMAPVQILIYFFFFVKISKSYPPILFLFSKNFLYIKKNFKNIPPKNSHQKKSRTKNSTQKFPIPSITQITRYKTAQKIPHKKFHTKHHQGTGYHSTEKQGRFSAPQNEVRGGDGKSTR